MKTLRDYIPLCYVRMILIVIKIMFTHLASPIVLLWYHVQIKKGAINLTPLILYYSDQATPNEIARSFGISKESVISLPILLKHLDIVDGELLKSDESSLT